VAVIDKLWAFLATHIALTKEISSASDIFISLYWLRLSCAFGGAFSNLVNLLFLVRDFFPA
jgi:hypothetical protein